MRRPVEALGAGQPRSISSTGRQLYFDATSPGGVSHYRNAAEWRTRFGFAVCELVHKGWIGPHLLNGNAGVGALISQVPQEVSAIVGRIAPKVNGQGVGSRAGQQN